MERIAHGLLQPLDLVLDHQFTALQFDDPQIVRGQMPHGIVQFAFQNPMFAFQFNEMRLNCHQKSPLSDGPQLWTWTGHSTLAGAAVDRNVLQLSEMSLHKENDPI